MSGLPEGQEGVDPAISLRPGQSQRGQGPEGGPQLSVGPGRQPGQERPNVLPQHHPEDEGRVVQPGG